MGLFHRHDKIPVQTERTKDFVPGEDSHTAMNGEPPGCIGIPIGIFQGYQDTTHAIIHALPGGYTAQVDPSPVTFARYNMSRGMHDVQLNNGWQRTNYGKRTVYASSGYLNEVMPQIPGQSRLSGTQTGDFVMRGPAPAQWQNIVDNVQSQPSNPGGPGQVMGTLAKGSSAWGSSGARG
jgi:hypothetical protein